MNPRPISELPALHTTGSFPELAVFNHGLRMDAVIDALRQHGSRRMVDVGCGDGALLKKIIASDLKLQEYMGIDSWTERLDAIQATADSDLHVHYGQAR